MNNNVKNEEKVSWLDNLPSNVCLIYGCPTSGMDDCVTGLQIDKSPAIINVNDLMNSYLLSVLPPKTKESTLSLKTIVNNARSLLENDAILRRQIIPQVINMSCAYAAILASKLDWDEHIFMFTDLIQMADKASLRVIRSREDLAERLYGEGIANDPSHCLSFAGFQSLVSSWNLPEKEDYRTIILKPDQNMKDVIG